MFEIKTGEAMMNKTFRLPVVLVKRLETTGKKAGVSVNNLVRQCCEYALGQVQTKGVAEGAKEL